MSWWSDPDEPIDYDAMYWEQAVNDPEWWAGINEAGLSMANDSEEGLKAYAAFLQCFVPEPK